MTTYKITLQSEGKTQTFDAMTINTFLRLQTKLESTCLIRAVQERAQLAAAKSLMAESTRAIKAFSMTTNSVPDTHFYACRTRSPML